MKSNYEKEYINRKLIKDLIKQNDDFGKYLKYLNDNKIAIATICEYFVRESKQEISQDILIEKIKCQIDKMVNYNIFKEK